MSKLKKAIKVVSKGVGTLISEVLARTFSYSFEHTSYIIYWYQNPHGTRDEADKFCADNGQYIVDNIDGLVDGVLYKVAEKLDIDKDADRWTRRLDALESFILDSDKPGRYAYLDSINEIRAAIQANGFVTGIDRCKIRHMEDEYGLKEV
jgi:hypothetical protein